MPRLIDKDALLAELEDVLETAESRWDKCSYEVRCVQRCISEVKAAQEFTPHYCQGCRSFCEFTEEYKKKYGADGECMMLRICSCDEQLPLKAFDDYCSNWRCCI